MSNKIKIEWLSDSSDCDTCGNSWATGAMVWLDTELILDLSPYAHCCNNVSYDSEKVFVMLLEKLGYEIEQH